MRSDWEAKLREDCRRIAEGNYQIDVVVFVSTRTMTVQKRENLRAEIRKAHGWDTEFFDLERLRALLTGPLRSLVPHHLSIFVSPWFERRGGEVVFHEVRVLIVIDHLAEDHAFAAWLFSRLSAAGYSVWCRGLAPLAGEEAHASILAIVRQRAARYIPVLSSTSVDDSNLRARTAITTSHEGLVVPCWLRDLTASVFDSGTTRLVPARFDSGWKQGLAALTQQLEVGPVPRPLREVGLDRAPSHYRGDPVRVAGDEGACLVSQSRERYGLVVELRDRDVDVARAPEGAMFVAVDEVITDHTSANPSTPSSPRPVRS